MFIEFLTQQWPLAGAWLVLLFLLFFHESRKGGKAVGPQRLTGLVNREEGLVLDIRDGNEFRKGHITGAVNIPFKDLAGRVSEIDSHRDKPVIVVCKHGQSAGAAGKILKANGFEQVYKLTGGLSEWTAASLPLVK